MENIFLGFKNHTKQDYCITVSSPIKDENNFVSIYDVHSYETKNKIMTKDEIEKTFNVLSNQ